LLSCVFGGKRIGKKFFLFFKSGYVRNSGQYFHMPVKPIGEKLPFFAGESR
jgi:hypothetical protein